VIVATVTAPRLVHRARELSDARQQADAINLPAVGALKMLSVKHVGVQRN